MSDSSFSKWWELLQALDRSQGTALTSKHDSEYWRVYWGMGYSFTAVYDIESTEEFLDEVFDDEWEEYYES